MEPWEKYYGFSFVFSKRFRLARHVLFWSVHVLIFSFLFWDGSHAFWNMLMLSLMWVPVFILFAYPIMYWLIPSYLLKGKFYQFSFLLLFWAVGGYFLNYWFRIHFLFPAFDFFAFKSGNRNPWATNSYLTMNVMAVSGSMIVLFKYSFLKQKEFLLAEKEKVKAELQLLKAQIHPHFLFNTLNNIYSFSLHNSEKTSQMILKLSSLLSYMLYDCKANQVLLEKEIEIMKAYIELEKERYDSRLEVSLNIVGDIYGKWIAPLIMLPFLENAFKHGTSEQLEKAWLSLDISVNQEIFQCKIVNSKNETVPSGKSGIGIMNIKKRLDYLYSGNYQLKLSDEGIFFVVSLILKFKEDSPGLMKSVVIENEPQNYYL